MNIYVYASRSNLCSSYIHKRHVRKMELSTPNVNGTMFKELQNSSNYPIASSESKSLILVNIKKSRNQQNLFKIIFNLHRQTIFHFHLLIVRAVFQLQKIDFCSTDDINYYCLQSISSAPSKQCHFASFDDSQIFD